MKDTRIHIEQYCKSLTIFKNVVHLHRDGKNTHVSTSKPGLVSFPHVKWPNVGHAVVCVMYVASPEAFPPFCYKSQLLSCIFPGNLNKGSVSWNLFILFFFTTMRQLWKKDGVGFGMTGDISSLIYLHFAITPDGLNISPRGKKEKLDHSVRFTARFHHQYQNMEHI